MSAINPKIDPIKEIRKDLQHYFESQGIPARIIYRTCQSQFRGEPPHNLIPNKIKNNRLSIFLDFEEVPIPECLNKIVAVPESHAPHLPKMTSRFGMEKIDVSSLPPKYFFSDIDDLKTNYHRLYK